MDKERSEQVVGKGIPTRPERSMLDWFKDNVLALLLITASAVSTYTLAEGRITALEVKLKDGKSVDERILTEIRSIKNDSIESLVTSNNRYAELSHTAKAQKEQAARSEKVITNNTIALNRIGVLFAKIDGKLDNYEIRIERLEENE